MSGEEFMFDLSKANIKKPLKVEFFLDPELGCSR
jgi:hypothetical protein